MPRAPFSGVGLHPDRQGQHLATQPLELARQARIDRGLRQANLDQLGSFTTISVESCHPDTDRMTSDLLLTIAKCVGFYPGDFTDQVEA
ncbi:hypothetical protein DYE42_07175 [Aeromonas dhakensis]|nr:hypothetical protein DYE42_07175 [Aeromonas dhakensis]